MGALEGSVAAVSGGMGGVGGGIAKAFVREGARVVVSGLDARRLAELGGNGRLAFYPGIPSERVTVEGLVDFAAERFGRLDVLVLSPAGPNGAASVAELDDDRWQQVLDLNLNHVFWGIRRALHHMLPRGEGRIIVTSALEGKLPRAGASGYVAAQHAVNGLVKSVAHEVSPKGIAVNAILPGVLDGTDEQLLERSKLGRPNTVEEVASVAVLLATPSITSISGCLFPVDGGTMPY
jgi:NAD(P)-dependent dehydrogenase (short-subunit alcohol dehydrogenase family)